MEEILKEYFDKYVKDLQRVVKYWEDGDGIYTKAEIVDVLNCTHSTFTNKLDSFYVHDKINSDKWTHYHALAFKEYRKAVHSL